MSWDVGNPLFDFKSSKTSYQASSRVSAGFKRLRGYQNLVSPALQAVKVLRPVLVDGLLNN